MGFTVKEGVPIYLREGQTAYFYVRFYSVDLLNQLDNPKWESLNPKTVKLISTLPPLNQATFRAEADGTAKIKVTSRLSQIQKTTDGYTREAIKVITKTVEVRVGYTKGTKSDYAKMGLAYPLEDTTIKTISSPYGPRPHLGESLDPHLGIDITCSGKKVVAVADGIIEYVQNKNAGLSGGNMVAYSIDTRDPVTGNRLRFINMHMRDIPTWEDGPNAGKPIVIGHTVKKGQVIGYSGNTGGSSTGYHLHFEVYNNTNNYIKASSQALENRINPTFLYPNIKFIEKTNSTCGLYYDIDPKYLK